MHAQMKRLYFAAKELKGISTQTELARSLSASPQTLVNWESRGVSKRGLLHAQRVLGCLASWVETGAGDMAMGAHHVAPRSDDGEALIRIESLANVASMGPGEHEEEHDMVLGEITLTPKFITERLRPSDPAAMRFIHARGDSMEPTFHSGDILLVDTGRHEITVDGVYVLAAHGRLFIKRVRQRIDGSYEISSDNPAHKTVDVLRGGHAVTVIGRVLWAWNGHKI